MPKLHRIELSEVISELPDIQPFDPKSEPVERIDHLFLCALGFEDRCLTLPRLLAATGYRTESAVCLVYSTNQTENEVNREKLDGYLRTFARNVSFVDSDSPDFSNRLRGLVEGPKRKSVRQRPRITFDSSVAANRLLITCMKVLMESNADVRVLYSEAATYHPTKQAYQESPEQWLADEALGLERGVSNVIVSRDHPGHHFDPLPDCVIVFPTFKVERTRAVINFVDPSLITGPEDRVSWLLGIPHLEEDQWRLEALRAINCIMAGSPEYQVSAFNYKETLTTLEGIHAKKLGKYKLSVSPLGSKMQALGASLFCYLHPDVRIVLAVPKSTMPRSTPKGARQPGRSTLAQCQPYATSWTKWAHSQLRTSVAILRMACPRKRVHPLCYSYR